MISKLIDSKCRERVEDQTWRNQTEYSLPYSALIEDDAAINIPLQCRPESATGNWLQKVTAYPVDPDLAITQ
jgi:hypothetical protein